jgi:hypothetical protein
MRQKRARISAGPLWWGTPLKLVPASEHRAANDWNAFCFVNGLSIHKALEPAAAAAGIPCLASDGCDGAVCYTLLLYVFPRSCGSGLSRKTITAACRSLLHSWDSLGADPQAQSWLPIGKWERTENISRGCDRFIFIQHARRIISFRGLQIHRRFHSGLLPRPRKRTPMQAQGIFLFNGASGILD